MPLSGPVQGEFNTHGSASSPPWVIPDRVDVDDSVVRPLYRPSDEGAFTGAFYHPLETPALIPALERLSHSASSDRDRTGERIAEFARSYGLPRTHLFDVYATTTVKEMLTLAEGVAIAVESIDQRQWDIAQRAISSLLRADGSPFLVLPDAGESGLIGTTYVTTLFGAAAMLLLESARPETAFRRCEWCRGLFTPTRAKQRFCPSTEVGEITFTKTGPAKYEPNTKPRSRCSDAARQDRLRKRRQQRALEDLRAANKID